MRSSFRGIYWGGAIIALLADIEIRRRSAGRQGLEHGLFALLDNDGHASEVWGLDDAVGVVDRAIGHRFSRTGGEERHSRAPVGARSLVR